MAIVRTGIANVLNFCFKLLLNMNLLLERNLRDYFGLQLADSIVEFKTDQTHTSEDDEWFVL